MAGAVSAASVEGAGGRVLLGAGTVSSLDGGVVDVSGGTTGGLAILDSSAGETVIGGRVSADGGSGSGGGVIVRGSSGVNVGNTGEVSADGASGGRVSVDTEGETEIDGELRARGSTGMGGDVEATGDRVILHDEALLDASGEHGGGNVSVGGGFQGNDRRLRNSSETEVESGARIRVDSLGNGNAGRAVVWSDGSTFYGGDITARALGEEGRGGPIEVSGKETLKFVGTVDVSAVSHRNGTLLLDPGNVSIGDLTTDVPIPTLNQLLQAGTQVIVATRDGDITVEAVGASNFGGDSLDNRGTGDYDGDTIPDSNDLDAAVQWTNSLGSLGLFAGGNVNLYNHVRTSGGGTSRSSRAGPGTRRVWRAMGSRPMSTGCRTPTTRARTSGAR